MSTLKRLRLSLTNSKRGRKNNGCFPTMGLGLIKNVLAIYKKKKKKENLPCTSSHFLLLAATKHGHKETLKYLRQRTDVESVRPQKRQSKHTLLSLSFFLFLSYSCAATLLPFYSNVHGHKFIHCCLTQESLVSSGLK